MKKVLILLAVVVFFAGSAMASFTADQSKGGLPAVLTTDSDIAAITYPSLLGNFANQAMIEFNWGGVQNGYLTINTDLGVFNFISAPAANDGIGLAMGNVNSPGDSTDNIFGISYATKLEGLVVGGTIMYGNNSSAMLELDPDDGVGQDEEYDNDSYFGIVLGASIEGDLPIDVSLGLGMNGELDEDSNFNATDVLIDWEKDQTSVLSLNLAARTILMDTIINLNVLYVMSTEIDEDILKDAGGNITQDHITTQTDSNLQIDILAGKEIKVTDSLTINVGGGISIEPDGISESEFKDRDAGTDAVITPNDWNDELDIYVPLFLAGEGKLDETWTFRGGVTVLLLAVETNSYKDRTAGTDTLIDEDQENYTWTDAGTVEYALGVTAKIGDVTIDLEVEPTFLLMGPSFITGVDTGMDLVSNVAIGFKW